jgi:hypothetical protein
MSRWSWGLGAIAVGLSLACAGVMPVDPQQGGVPAGGGGGGGGYHVCFAEGVYTTCTTNNGWENCQDQLARSGGEGGTQGDAAGAATMSCTDHMLSMMIIGNMGSNSRSSIKSSCQVTECTP